MFLNVEPMNKNHPPTPRQRGDAAGSGGRGERGRRASMSERTDAEPVRAHTQAATLKPVFVVTFRDTGEAPPLAIRTRMLMKLALRVYGFRCVDIRNVSDGDTMT